MHNSSLNCVVVDYFKNTINIMKGFSESRQEAERVANESDKINTKLQQLLLQPFPPTCGNGSCFFHALEQLLGQPGVTADLSYLMYTKYSL